MEDINNLEQLKEQLGQSEIELQGKFFVGVSIGVMPQGDYQVTRFSSPKWNLQKIAMFQQMVEQLQKEGHGVLLHYEDNCIHLLGVFPKEDKQNFYEKYIHGKRMEAEQKYQISLVVGIGSRVDRLEGIKNLYKTAKLANELFFFEEKMVIDIEDIHKEYTVSFEDYQEAVDNLFQSIIMRDGNVLKNVDRIVEMIGQIHYGNVYATRARILLFSGDITMKLCNYKLLDEDFYGILDQLQEKVEGQITFSEMKKCVMKHYEMLIADIYRAEKSKSAQVIEKVKKYMQSNYGEDISVKSLAALACVSENYFSAMFKQETGENYKSYLTGIRMEKAMGLVLNTDLKTYEISEQVGYNSVRRFVDTFKKYYGMSPMEYKKNRIEFKKK